jgi:hypothetical protein
VVGHGAHVPVRPAGRDHQAVGDGAFSFEVDEDHVLGFVIVKLGQDQMLQGVDATLVLEGGLVGLDGGPGRLLLRARRGVTVQRGCSFDVLARLNLARKAGPVSRPS